jgi:hypothetical protein
VNVGVKPRATAVVSDITKNPHSKVKGFGGFTHCGIAGLHCPPYHPRTPAAYLSATVSRHHTSTPPPVLLVAFDDRVRDAPKHFLYNQ